MTDSPLITHIAWGEMEVEGIGVAKDFKLYPRGVLLALQTCPETLELLRGEDIPVHIEETRAAVERYNALARDTAVGGLFHSTC
jgi:hypothetical protein